MENNNINETDITNKFANILSDGCRTIRPELKQAWYQTVIKSLQQNSDINDFNYQLASFIAAVKGFTIADASFIIFLTYISPLNNPLEFKITIAKLVKYPLNLFSIDCIPFIF